MPTKPAFYAGHLFPGSWGQHWPSVLNPNNALISAAASCLHSVAQAALLWESVSDLANFLSLSWLVVSLPPAGLPQLVISVFNL